MSVYLGFSDFGIFLTLIQFCEEKKNEIVVFLSYSVTYILIFSEMISQACPIAQIFFHEIIIII
ncbi:MAG: hypothetical protein ABW098_20010, partial [Candidatus Thiodiazotropha sp.]